MPQNPHNNLTRCPRCNGLLIYEELFNHSCFMIKSVFIDDKRIWINDGKEWYRRYGLPPTRNQHDFKHSDDSTEPNFIMINKRKEKPSYNNRSV